MGGGHKSLKQDPFAKDKRQKHQPHPGQAQARIRKEQRRAERLYSEQELGDIAPKMPLALPWNWD